MSISQIVEKATTSYVNRFKQYPERMAISYACIAVGYCIAYSGLILAIKELEKQDRELSDLRISIAIHNAYIEGVYDTLSKDQKHD